MTTDFLRQVHELHYATSRLEKRRILPKPLLDFICKPLNHFYTRNSPDLKTFLDKSYKAVNAFRDDLPIEAWDKHELTLLTKTAFFPLSYTGFAKFFREARFYPEYRIDFW